MSFVEAVTAEDIQDTNPPGLSCPDATYL